ncbi:MAG: anthranilate synthase component I [Granulosicoccus sp.]
MTPSDFERYCAEGFTRIPISCELIADLDNPLSTFMKVADLPYSFLFESVQGGEKWGRYSIIGLPSRTIIRVRARQVTIEQDGIESEPEDVAEPLNWIEKYQEQFKVPNVEGLPRITGGLVGYFGYDTVRYVEPKLGLNPHPDPIGNPDILLMVTEELVVFDNLSGKLTIIVLVDPEQQDARVQGLKRVAQLHDKIRAVLPVRRSPHASTKVAEADFESGFTESGYKRAVKKIIEYITQGECMQVVLSQRLSIPFAAPALDLYRSLRTLNPSPYMFYLDLGDHHVVGASPEILVRLEDSEVTVRPLAGTRPRGANEADDQALEQSLLEDPKELAEHLMLIDLGRNDIGRIAQTGTVEVTDKFSIERYSHVMHIVSNVVGNLKSGMSPMDVLKATFPAGTLSGAPKVRAMEIIQELEPVKRGVYSGAVGYLSWNGNMDTAIAIRTAVVKDGTLNVQAGAGIVYDSDPESEWQETHSKARAIFRAVTMAEAGLDAPPEMFAELADEHTKLNEEGI